jgi:hypothetical protein
VDADEMAAGMGTRLHEKRRIVHFWKVLIPDVAILAV